MEPAPTSSSAEPAESTDNWESAEEWIVGFLQKHCTEQDDHDDPHTSCRKCATMKLDFMNFISELARE